jgi:hypothetical protein
MNWIEELYKLEVEYNLLKLNGNKKTKIQITVNKNNDINNNNNIQ